MADEKPSVPLQHYIESKMDERDKRYEQRFEAQEKALAVASDSSRGTIATVISILSLLMALFAMFWRH